MITQDNLPDALVSLGFQLSEGTEVYTKTWESGASIGVDMGKRLIVYPVDDGFKVNKATTCNFSDNESFVVLVCVTKLFDKGYRPESLELEREWTLGHEQKSGRADICVNDEYGETFCIIECKTPGAEFRDEWKTMQADGGQLFSYWQQERACRWLVLYTCDFVDDEISVQQHSVSCEDDENFKALARRDDTILLYSAAHTVEQLHEVWTETYNQQAEGDVLFGERSTAYHPDVPPLLKKDLVDFRAEDRIVNRFEEILRHNNVSDKENAFNRLVALFIAKLQDELSKGPNQEVEFQYRQGRDTYETLQDRLQRLHSEGMRKLMREDVLYVPNDYADKVVSRFTGQERKRLIEELNGTLRKLKFYTNSDFAFKDVHNEELFLQNGKVLVEVVQLLQPYRIVESGDVQFLGDLFEQLLNQGFKQNEGQFFTPMPITRFIWRSLPLDELVRDEGEGVRYPRVIDYACGAGHFLTEGFEEISNAAYQYDPYFEDSAGDADWVRGNLVGVEKDYRLARVSRVALYMHGAGQGEIVFGDGLENYPDKGIDSRKDSGRFDVLAANPPYSVAAFKPHLKLRNNELKVLDEISDNGSEIETLFVERAAQIVRPGGYAAIILPSSILDKGTNSSFVAARDVLLSSFELVAIARFGSGTFAATGTNVAIMFMRRFDEVPTRDASARDFVDAVFAGRDLNGWRDAGDLAAYLKKVKVGEDDYRVFIHGKRDWAEWSDVPHFGTYSRAFAGSPELKALRKTRAYKVSDAAGKQTLENERFYVYAHGEERKRLRVWGLVSDERTLVVNSPTATKEVASFLGYKWSNRKGNEGIQLLDGGGVLYSDDLAAGDDDKLSGIIRAWFGGEEAEPGDLSQWLYYADTADFIDFDAERFDETLKMPRTFYRQREFVSGVSVKALGDVACYVTEGVPQTKIVTSDYVTTENMAKDREGIMPYEGDAPATAGTAYMAGDTLVSNIRPYLQKIWLADRDGACSKDVLVFRSKDTTVLLPEFLHLLLWQRDFFDYDMSTFTGTGRPRGDKNQILRYRVPVPSLAEQHTLVEEFDRLSVNVDAMKKREADLRDSVRAKFEELFGPADDMTSRFESVELGTCVMGIEAGKSPRCQGRARVNDEPGVLKLSAISSGNYRPTENKAMLPGETINHEKEVQLGDILIARKNTPELVGACVLVSVDEPNLMFPDIVFRMHPKQGLNGTYLATLLGKTSFAAKIKQLAHGSAASMSGIPKIALEHLRIPLPPIMLQQEFADFAERAEREQAELERQVDGLSTRRDGLLDRYLA